jgi:ATP-dependent DNA helicase RecG
VFKLIPLRYIKGVGPARENILNKAGVYNLKDLLYYFPFRYEDRRDIKKIREVVAGDFCLLKGLVFSKKLKKMPYFLQNKRVRNIFEVILDDTTGKIRCSWFNQGYLDEKIKIGDELIVYGKASFYKDGLQLISPGYASSQGQSLDVGRIVGIYTLPHSFSQKFMHKIIFNILKESADYPDPLPFYIRKDKGLLNIAKSLEEIHFPTSWEAAKAARERFIFEELFFSQIQVYLRKAQRVFQKGVKFEAIERAVAQIRKNLTFTLTPSQEEALSEIENDLKKPYPMYRLLQGDVGCGKTIIAAFAIGMCVSSGWQAALMVPTEVLAYQHGQTLKQLFQGIDFFSQDNFEEEIQVITSSLSKKELDKVYKDLSSGKIKLAIGTHALIQKEVEFRKLGLVVIDEQHRFGVAQRSLLPKKGKITPHYLVMSATPIPRSLALSLYGDLDLLVIKEMPKGRLPAEVIGVKEKERKWVYDFIEARIKEGRQVYVVYPVIDETLDEELNSLKVMHKKIKERFSDYSVGMFHGQMKSEEKFKIIEKFRENKINILVSTTVIEAGVNIENATTMVVENPERFGLAQLHQLRGRIQRSNYKPHFILITKDNLSVKAAERLDIIYRENSGFKIAEEDLKLRGPGDFFGNLQHGLPDLKIANPLKDLEILKQARLLAYKVIKKDPHLKETQHRYIREYLKI